VHRVPGRNRANTVGLAMGAVLLSILATLVVLDVTLAAGRQSPIAGDPPQYDVISAAILDGAIPYLDVPVEHLPGSLIPMVAVGLLSRVTELSFETLWPFAMGILRWESRSLLPWPWQTPSRR